MCHTSFTQFKMIVIEYDVTEIETEASLFGALSSSVCLRWLVSHLMVIGTFGPNIPKKCFICFAGQ